MELNMVKAVSNNTWIIKLEIKNHHTDMKENF